MSNARALLLFLLALALLACGLQMVIDFSSENVASACTILASSLAILLYMLWTPALQTHPLSTFALFGFCFTTQLGALIVQTAYITAVVEHLRQPMATFATLAMFQALALVAHAVYRMFSAHRPGQPAPESPVRSLLSHLGLYTTPTPGAVWLMGAIGLFCFVLSGHGPGITGKVLQGFSFAAWTPFLIPMYVLRLGPAYCNVKRNYAFLAMYAALIALLGVAANARGLMLSGLMTIALYVVLNTLRNSDPVRAARVAQLAVLAAVLGAMTIPLTDLVTAMLLARGIRSESTPAKMVEETFYYLQQPQLLQQTREELKQVSAMTSYDETYFANPLMQRLIETKFHDNALYFGARLNEHDAERLLDVTDDALWSTLPEPMLKGLDIDVDKATMGYSMGDYISYLAGAGDLGGYKTGSGFAQGLALAGRFFPLIYLLACPVFFLTQDLLSFRGPKGEVWVSALGMLGIWRMFQYGISAESLQMLFMTVVRDLPQKIVLYLLLFYFSRWGAGVLAALFGQGGGATRRQAA